MKAIVYDRYGSPDVLRLEEVPTPSPKAGEVLVRIHATTVSSGDWRMRSLDMPAGFGLIARPVFGLSGPRQRILGSEFSGTVESVGAGVSRFRAGDAVLGFAGVNLGCHAEYRCMPENGGLALKPGNLDFDEAAALCFGGTTALDFFRRAKLRAGEKVLVNGASGAVGTAAVQLARHAGAQVTGVCSAANAELVRSLGATHAIDYAREDFTRSGEIYDVILDAAGTAPYSRSRVSLNDGGRLLLVLAGLGGLLAAPWVSMTTRHRVIAGTAAERPADVQALADLAAAGAFKPVIDRRYAFDQFADAHRRVDSGRKRGNVVMML
jgi:NADPH:quinone reductase-like Zn-dependent oxidoreductase